MSCNWFASFFKKNVKEKEHANCSKVNSGEVFEIAIPNLLEILT